MIIGNRAKRSSQTANRDGGRGGGGVSRVDLGDGVGSGMVATAAPSEVCGPTGMADQRRCLKLGTEPSGDLAASLSGTPARRSS
jgi:hypothetical protein